MTRALLSAWRFFRSQLEGGMCPALCALRMARAEREAQERGWRFVWATDDDADLLLEHDSAWCRKDCGIDHELWYCALRTTDSTWALASLSGIIDPTADYRRVVEAELADEALADEDAYRSAIAG